MGPESEDKADPETAEAALREGIERAKTLVRRLASDVIHPEPPAIKTEPAIDAEPPNPAR